MTEMPWAGLARRGWRIIGMNHYRMSGEYFLFVSMGRKSRYIKAEGMDEAEVFNALERKASNVKEG